MRCIGIQVLCAAAGLAPCALGDQVVAYVPASRDSRVMGVFREPTAPSEADVRYVGPAPAGVQHQAGQRRTLRIEIPEEPPAEETGEAGPVPAAPDVPEGAQWPDSRGRIVVAPPPGPGASTGAAVSNPWEMRIRPHHQGRDTELFCGSVIIGGDRGPVAIVNGRILRRGDSLGDFSVSGVVREGVILELLGRLLVAPRGKTTIVSDSGG